MDNPAQFIHHDCRHIRWSRPCDPHKKEGVTCAGCPHYDKVKRRILLVKLAADGDVLRTTGVVPVLRDEVEGLHLTWLTAPSAAPLLAGHPGIDRVLVADGNTPPEIMVEVFDQVICPDADPHSCALAAVARTGTRRGYTLNEYGMVRPISPGAKEWLWMGLNDQAKAAGRRTYQEIMRNVLELSRIPGPPRLELTGAEREGAARFREEARIPDTGPLVGFNTGAGARWPQKRWPEERYLELGTHLVAKGCTVLLLGGPAEEARNLRLRRRGGKGFFDAGSRNPVRDFAARVGLCDLLVTGDTLALHIGVALGLPVVANFGPTSSHEINLFGKGEKVLPPGMGCLCCYDTVCTRTPTCQETIPFEVVRDAVERWLP